MKRTGLIIAGLIIAGFSCAEILYDWDFSKQVNGTTLAGVASAGTQPAVNFPGTAVANGLVVSNGSLYVNRTVTGAGNTPNNSFAPITALSSGTYWVVTEIAGWNMETSGAIMDIMFSKGGTTGDNVAGFRMSRKADDISLQLLHGGGTATPKTIKDFLSAESVQVALEVNLDTDKTQLHIKIGTNDWTSGAVQNRSNTDSDITHIRFGASGFGADDYILVDRIYVTDVNPLIMVPEPGTISLFLIAAGGAILSRRIAK